MPEWGLGRYESTALELEPVARRVVSMAAPLQGRRVLDIACGTGNAALLAAEAGASVVGLDQAPRLIEVAKERAAAGGLDVSFVVGDAEQIDFADESFDVAFSVFGVIFAPDPERAFAEIVRVLRPGGPGVRDRLAARRHRRCDGGHRDARSQRCHRVLPSARAGVARRRRRGGAGHPARGNRGVPRGGDLVLWRIRPRLIWPSTEENHPMAVEVRPILESSGTGQAVHDKVVAVLKAGNEDPSAFKVTSRYRVVEVTR